MIIPKLSMFHKVNMYFENIPSKNHSEISWFKQCQSASIFDVASIKVQIDVKSDA